MLIVEGPDLVGKTTLAKKLATYLNDHGWPHVYRHLSRLPESWRVQSVANYRRLMSPYVVQDRFHMSEPMYATMRRDAAFLGPSSYAQVQRELRNFEAFTIVITADESLIRRRYERCERPEMYKLADILRVNDLYFAAMQDGGNWNGYDLITDLWIHCQERDSFPEIGEHMNLHTYMNRMQRTFPYPGATRVA
jgi:hypothetical protein